MPWIEAALKVSSGCAVFLGKHGWGPTHFWEAEKALHRFNEDPDFRLIPVLIHAASPADVNRLGQGAVFEKLNWIRIPDGPPTRDTIEELRRALSGELSEVTMGPARLTPYLVRREAFRWWRDRDASILYRARQLSQAQKLAIEVPALMSGVEVTAFLAAASYASIRRTVQLGALGAAVLGVVGFAGGVLLRSPGWAWVALDVPQYSVENAVLDASVLHLKLWYFEHRQEEEIDEGPTKFFLNVDIDEGNEVTGCVAYSYNLINSDTTQTVGCESYESGAGSLAHLLEKDRRSIDEHRVRAWLDDHATPDQDVHSSESNAECGFDPSAPFKCRISMDGGKSWIDIGTPAQDFKPADTAIVWITDPGFTLLLAATDRKEIGEEEYGRGGLYRWREKVGWEEIGAGYYNWHDYRNVFATRLEDGRIQLTAVAGYKNSVDSGEVPANVPGIFVSYDQGDSWTPLKAGWNAGLQTRVAVHSVFPGGEILAANGGRWVLWRPLSLAERFRMPTLPERGAAMSAQGRALVTESSSGAKEARTTAPTPPVEPAMLSIQEQVVQLIAEDLGVREEVILLDAHLCDELGADSFDLISLRLGAEEAFEIELTDEEWGKVRTVGDIVTAVSNHRTDLDAYASK